jgi:hypothetical protein
MEGQVVTQCSRPEADRYSGHLPPTQPIYEFEPHLPDEQAFYQFHFSYCTQATASALGLLGELFNTEPLLDPDSM